MDIEKLEAAALEIKRKSEEMVEAQACPYPDYVMIPASEILELIAEIKRLRSLNADCVYIIKQQPANNRIPDYLRNPSSGGERSPYPASWNVNSCGDQIKDAS